MTDEAGAYALKMELGSQAPLATARMTRMATAELHNVCVLHTITADT